MTTVPKRCSEYKKGTPVIFRRGIISLFLKKKNETLIKVHYDDTDE